ncbi:MAG: serine/threonine protein kinase [Polyangiaceae bacterium]|nr:serine/threonine protein kinase [Polyangiaceae bacterium]
MCTHVAAIQPNILYSMPVLSDDDTLAALAQTIAPGATALTYRPAEVIVRSAPNVDLPISSLSIASGASPEDTVMFVERLAQSERAPAPSVAESYEIVAPIGKGGMGEVWRAVQRSLGREIALKQLSTDNPVAAEHFFSEARVTARLSHANIVPVHALGRTGDGRPMLAMKLVKGRSWHDILLEEGATRDLNKHLAIFLAVTNAVAFAHSEGFLHRDLKPANVMVGEFGQVFVVDWGLAVGLDREACESHGILFAGDVRSPAGTPAYMAPELARGDGSSQGPATDVYCLGACLHEIVTGKPPHDGTDTAAVLRHAVASAVPEYGPDVPRELADICRKAMAKSPADRYPTAVPLRAAVELYLSHEAARQITRKGLASLDRLKEQIVEYKGISPTEEAEFERLIHRTYTEARFAFEHALESWADDSDAQRGIENAARTMLEHALVTEDLPLAMRLLAEVNEPELHRQVEELRARVLAREKELASLREQANLLDDRRVAKPLSRVFIVAGLAGGIASLPTRHFLAQGAKAATVPITVLWTALTFVTGAYALYVLRGATKSLVSPRVGFTWAAVGIACLGAGATAIARGEAPFDNAPYTTSMIAIGFVAQAMQTRMSLLFPAITTFAGALAMGFFPTYRVEFPVVWLLSLTGVGILLRRAATESKG